MLVPFLGTYPNRPFIPDLEFLCYTIYYSILYYTLLGYAKQLYCILYYAVLSYWNDCNMPCRAPPAILTAQPLGTESYRVRRGFVVASSPYHAVHVYTYRYIYIYNIHIHVHIHIHTHLYIYVIYIYIYVNIFVAYVCIHIYVYIIHLYTLCTCIYTYCTYIYIYMCIYNVYVKIMHITTYAYIEFPIHLLTARHNGLYPQTKGPKAII